MPGLRTGWRGWRERLAAAWTGAAPVTPYAFALFRWVFGLYLAVHCAGLIPWGAELFSREGVLPDPAVNPLHGLFPNPLAWLDAPWFVTAWLVAMTLAALAFAAGIARRAVAVALWFGLACLFNRNNLIANPSLPYVGVLLLLTALAPTGEVWSLRRRPAVAGWTFPATAYQVAWVLMAVGYSYSGLVKLASPSWVDGSALAHVLDNPLARPGPLREALAAAPGMLALATWGALAVEILAVPLSLVRRARPWWWLAAVGLQLGILAMVDFADLTGGMLMLHLFTFDRRWLPGRRPVAGGRHLVLYDGVCGLCDRAVRFLVAEDRDGVLHYAALQGETAARVLARLGLPELAPGGGETPAPEGEKGSEAEPGAPDTMVFVRDEGTPRERAFLRSSGSLAAFDAVGGIWRAVSWLRALPAPLRDAGYRAVASRRYRWFGRYDTCLIPPAEVRARLLD